MPSQTTAPSVWVCPGRVGSGKLLRGLPQRRETRVTNRKGRRARHKRHKERTRVRKAKADAYRRLCDTLADWTQSMFDYSRKVHVRLLKKAQEK